MADDKVDLLLAPWGTAFYLAVVPVANKYGYPIIGSAAAADQLTLRRPYSTECICFVFYERSGQGAGGSPP